MNLLRIGTRCSRLSLRQTSLAECFLRERLGDEFSRFSLVKITTSGDRILDKALYDIGGKGLFTKELDLALLDDRIDLAVHSAKDIESILPNGLVIACYLPRGDRRDCLITAQNSLCASVRDDGVACLLGLAKGSLLGTASPRRRALVRLLRNDLEITLLRGNIDRRLASLSSGANEAIILASCALERLDDCKDKSISKDKSITMSKLDEDSFVPAAGQGAIAIVVRESDSHLREKLRAISDHDCQIEVSAERAFLRQIGGSCHTPLGASARLRRARQDKTSAASSAASSDASLDEIAELSLCAFVIEGGSKKQLRLSEFGKANSPIGLEQAELLGMRMAKELGGASCQPDGEKLELTQDTTIAV